MMVCQNSRVVKGGQPTQGAGADQQNRSTGQGFSQMVKWSTPISFCCLSRQEEGTQRNYSVIERYEIGVDHLTTCRSPLRRLSLLLVNPSGRTLDRVDHLSAEVTL